MVITYEELNIENCKFPIFDEDKENIHKLLLLYNIWAESYLDEDMKPLVSYAKKHMKAFVLFSWICLFDNSLWIKLQNTILIYIKKLHFFG